MNECFQFRLDYDEITLDCEQQRNICIVGGTKKVFEKGDIWTYKYILILTS